MSKGSDINVTVGLAGEKEFKRGLDAINDGLKVNRSELALVEAQYGKSAQSSDALTAKGAALEKVLASQKEKIAALSEQLQKSAQKYGEAGRYTMRLQADLNKANAELFNTERQLSENAAALEALAAAGQSAAEEIGGMEGEIAGSEGALRRLSDAGAEAAKKAKELNKVRLDKFQKSIDAVSRKLKDAGDRMKGIGGSMSKYVTAPIAAGFGLLTKGTEEFRSDLSKLENAARMSGVHFDVMNDAMRDLNAVTGETDSNVEALSNLMAAGFDDSNLAQAVESLSGAVIKFPDTIKIESLSDSLQETIATGEAVGQFGELLGRLGIDSEKFSQGLAQAAKSGREQQYILDTLSKTTLPETARAYMANNQALVEGRQASYDMQAQLAQLGEKLQPLATRMTELAVMLLDKFNGLDEGTQDFILGLAALLVIVGPALSAIGGMSTGVSSLVSLFGAAPAKISGFGGALGILANPVAAVAAAVGAVVVAITLLYQNCDEFRELVDSLFANIRDAMERLQGWIDQAFATDWSEKFGAFGEVLNFFFVTVKETFDSTKRIFEGVLTFLEGIFQNDWKKVWTGVKEIFGGIWDKMVAVVKTPFNAIISMINGVIDGLNSLIGGLNKIKLDVPDWVPLIGGKTFQVNIPKIPKLQYLAKGTLHARRGLAVVGEKGPELVSLRGGERVFTAPQTRQMFSAAAAGASGRSVQIGQLVINPSAQQWTQLMQMIAQWNTMTQKGRAR